MKKVKLLTIACVELPQLIVQPLITSCATQQSEIFVTFISDGKVFKTQTLKIGSVLNKPLDPKKENYIFSGWFTDESFKYKYDFDLKLNKNITLYAKWESFDGKVTEEEWNNAINIITRLSETRNYKLCINADSQGIINYYELLVDGLKEKLTNKITPDSEINITPANKKWCYQLSINEDKKAAIMSFKEHSFTQQRGVSDSITYILSILSMFEENAKFSFKNANWIFNYEEKGYSTRALFDNRQFDVLIKFNINKKIGSFVFYTNYYGDYKEFDCSLEYDNQKLDIDEYNITEGNAPIVCYAQAGSNLKFSQSSKLFPFTTSKFDVEIISENDEATNFKLCLNGNWSSEHKYPEQDILIVRGQILPNETKKVTLDLSNALIYPWNDTKFLGKMTTLFLELDE